jgi:hypothetical protein
MNHSSWGCCSISGGEGVRDVRMIELWLGDPDDRYGVTTIRKGRVWGREGVPIRRSVPFLWIRRTFYVR